MLGVYSVFYSQLNWKRYALWLTVTNERLESRNPIINETPSGLLSSYLFSGTILATPRENAARKPVMLVFACSNNKGTNQVVHLRRLISAFVVSCWKRYMYIEMYAYDSECEQAGICQTFFFSGVTGQNCLKWVSDKAIKDHLTWSYALYLKTDYNCIDLTP